jgi:hypothetical protein
MTVTRAELERRAHELIQALERQHGGGPFSSNVLNARAALKSALTPVRDEADEAKEYLHV